MKINKRENLLLLLDKAQELGVIKNVKDNSLRDISFETNQGQFAHIEWFCNLCTLHFPGFSLWFDEIKITDTHPSYKSEIDFSYQGSRNAFIGLKYLNEVTENDTK